MGAARITIRRLTRRYEWRQDGLRARLRHYQESSGMQDAMQIELPKGTYAPVFRMRPSVGHFEFPG